MRRLRSTLLATAVVALLGTGAWGQALPPTPSGVLSAKAQAQLAQIEAMSKQAAGAGGAASLTPAQQRGFADQMQAMVGSMQLKAHAVDVQESTIAGVPVRVLTPKGGAKPGAVLLNVHGGGFVLDSGSLTENIPIADLTGLKVVAVRYRLSPENKFPAARDDTVAVYRELLKRYPADKIVLYGTSAGAVLAPQVIHALHEAKLPLPAALGFFSGSGDLGQAGDSVALFDPAGAVTGGVRSALVGQGDIASPEISPSRGDVSYFPRTLCLSSSRDVLLSGTANFCRVLDTAGVPTRFVVFDGMPHAFWSYIDAPETDEAFRIMARFMCTALKGACATSAKR